MADANGNSTDVKFLADPALKPFPLAVVTAPLPRVNLIWEYTQAAVAIIVVAANMIVGTYQGIYNTAATFPPILSSALFLIVGFYFSRTNHAPIQVDNIKPVETFINQP